MAGTTEYKNKWVTEKCDRVNLVLSKGRKEIIQAAAVERGESLNAFINTAITERLARIGAEDEGGATDAD